MRRISRRTLLAASGALVGGAAVDAFAIEPNWLEVSEHDFPVRGLRRELDGFAIAQVTDAHLTRLGAVERDVALALRQEEVQLAVLTGDIIDSKERLPLLLEFCRTLQNAGVVLLAALGNWEHWGRIPFDDLAKVYRDVGVTLLVNEARSLPDGIRVFATDDSTGGHSRLERPGGRHPDARLLLTHSPAYLDRIPDDYGRNVLALAGHTHGGQVRLGSGAVPYTPPGSGRFVAGWYDVSYGSAYVSRGTGTSVVPARFTCRPELPVFRLRQG